MPSENRCFSGILLVMSIRIKETAVMTPVVLVSIRHGLRRNVNREPCQVFLIFQIYDNN